MQQWTQRGVPLCQELFYVAWCRSEAPLVQKKTAVKKDLGYRAAQNRCSKKEDETSQLIDDFFHLSTRSTASWSPAPYESDTAYLASCSVWPRKCCLVGRRNLTVMLYCFIFLIPWLLKLQLCSRRTWSENFFSWALSLSLSVFLCEGIWTSD